MKKILFPVLALVLAVGVALPMAMPAAAHTESDPYSVDLLAGQDEDVGDVLVWNDGTSLHVTYVITASDWEITATHLYVGKNPPPTSAPGQFPYDDAVAASVTPTEVAYVIPLDSISDYTMQLNSKGKVTGVMTTDGDVGVGPCDDVYIAAQAEVQKVEVEMSTIQPELTWQRSAETAGAIAHFPGYGGQWDPETDGFAIPLDETQVVWDNGAYHIPPGTPSGSFASWNYEGVVGTQGPSYDPAYGSDLRRFHADFTMPDGCTVTGGTLSTVGFDGIPINDNVYVFVNEDLIFWGGTRANVLPAFEGMSGIQALRGTTDPPETDRWYIPGTLPPLTNVISGTNGIDVFTEENERWGGLGELVLSLDCETVITTTETAWGEGELIGVNSNWSMYFRYTVQGCRLVDTVDVPSDGSTVSSVSLEAGKTYLFKASGTYTYWPSAGGGAGIADAEYALRPQGSYNLGPGAQWIYGDDVYPPTYPDYTLDISVDGTDVYWGDFDSGHVYSYQYTGTGSPASFGIYDSYYGDNSGYLTVEIYECCE